MKSHQLMRRTTMNFGVILNASIFGSDEDFIRSVKSLSNEELESLRVATQNINKLAVVVIDSRKSNA